MVVAVRRKLKLQAGSGESARISLVYYRRNGEKRYQQRSQQDSLFPQPALGNNPFYQLLRGSERGKMASQTAGRILSQR